STRIELRLNDVMESQHGRAAAASVPAGVPGRGLRTDGAVVQVAAPGEGSAAGDLRGAVHLAAALAGSRWPGQSAAPLRRLADLGSLLERCTDTSAVAAAALGPDEAPDVLAALTDELQRRQVAVAAARRDGSVARHSSPVWLVADDYELVHAAARPGLMAE